MQTANFTFVDIQKHLTGGSWVLPTLELHHQSLFDRFRKYHYYETVSSPCESLSRCNTTFFAQVFVFRYLHTNFVSSLLNTATVLACLLLGSTISYVLWGLLFNFQCTKHSFHEFLEILYFTFFKLCINYISQGYGKGTYLLFSMQFQNQEFS